MVTYLATFWLNEGTPGGRINWWLHTLTLLLFLPLMPHTKHLHLVLSPVTIFTRRDGFSKIPPLAGDEDFGLDAGKDVTKLIALAGLHLRRVRTLHGVLPGLQYGKNSQSQGNHSGAARIT